MKQNKFLIMVVALMLFSVIASACGSTAPVEAVAPTEEISVPSFPTGRFIQEGSREYGITFNADGTFSVGNITNTFITGTYTADDKTFTETSNTGGCKTNISFNYTFDGTNLTFTYVGNPEDDASCNGRYADFNNVTYTLSK
ncbi:MAG: hypothetical protein JNK81_13310 [Anaerolineales bacterium]|nr:hypothetical protein [Anaerolineales bacterium]